MCESLKQTKTHMYAHAQTSTYWERKREVKQEETKLVFHCLLLLIILYCCHTVCAASYFFRSFWRTEVKLDSCLVCLLLFTCGSFPACLSVAAVVNHFKWHLLVKHVCTIGIIWEMYFSLKYYRNFLCCDCSRILLRTMKTRAISL